MEYQSRKLDNKVRSIIKKHLKGFEVAIPYNYDMEILANIPNVNCFIQGDISGKEIHLYTYDNLDNIKGVNISYDSNQYLIETY